MSQLNAKIYTTKNATNQYNIRYFMMDSPWRRDQEICLSKRTAAWHLFTFDLEAVRALLKKSMYYLL